MFKASLHGQRAPTTHRELIRGVTWLFMLVMAQGVITLEIAVAREHHPDDGKDAPATARQSKDVDAADAADAADADDTDNMDAPTEPEDGDDASDEQARVPSCETELRLSGTVYNASVPERSMALFHDQKTKGGSLYRTGALVSVFELESVMPRGVVLRGSEGLCFLRLEQDPNAKKTSSRRSRKSKKRSRKR